MPELPEVEFCRRRLLAWGRDQCVVEALVHDPGVVRTRLSTRPSDKMPEGVQWVQQMVVGQPVSAVLRHGKRLAWVFEGEDRGVLLHLGMTGKWVFHDTLPQHKSLRCSLRLEGGGWLCFLDTRRFGCLVPCEENLSGALAAGLGMDAYSAALTAEGLMETMQVHRPLKVALMDQRLLAGLGNIHAVEILWKAQLHPLARSRDLQKHHWARLARVIPAHLEEVLASEKGDEIVYMNEGRQSNPFAVYQRSGQVCSRCFDKIISLKVQGRSTFLCPGCQEMAGRP